MKITIAAVGRMKDGPDQILVDRYSDRINKSGRQLHLHDLTIREFPESRKPSMQARKTEEAEALVQTIAPETYLIVLDENGKNLGSKQFADLIAKIRDEGLPELVFAIGGPDGHGDQILQRANRKIALGSLTWPHQIVRILLCEQIYRAITILSGHPYHRE